MTNQKSPFKFDHREIIVIFSLFIFVSLLMFTVGIVVGKGLSQAKYEALLVSNGPAPQANAHKDSHASASAHEDSKASSHDDHAAADRQPSEDHHQPPRGDSPVDGHSQMDDSHAPSAEHSDGEQNDAHTDRAVNSEKHENPVAHAEAKSAEEKNKPLKLIPKERNNLDLSGSGVSVRVDPNNKADELLENPVIRNLLEADSKKSKTAKAKPASQAKPVPQDNERKTASKTPPPFPKSFPTGPFTVQVGSYPAKKDAVERVAKLKKLGFPHAYLSVKQFGTGQETWYRVWLGYYTSKNGANESGSLLQQRGEVKNYLVRNSDQSR